MSGGCPNPNSSQKILHASCVAISGKGLLIVGASGSGKSSLALSLMALGARLVSDDRVILEAGKDFVQASAPPTISGLIEAWGVGLLTCKPSPPVPVSAVVDMNNIETARLPETRYYELLGTPVPLFYKVNAVHFEAALLQFFKFGRMEC